MHLSTCSEWSSLNPHGPNLSLPLFAVYIPTLKVLSKTTFHKGLLAMRLISLNSQVSHQGFHYFLIAKSSFHGLVLALQSISLIKVC